MKVKLTDRFVQSAKSGDTAQADFFDDDEKVRGLALRVSATGRKVWTFVFTSPKDGKRARMTFGEYPAVGLGAARGRALEAKELLRGQPPVDPRDAARAAADGAMTVSALIDLWLEELGRKGRRSLPEVSRRFNRSIRPVIGMLKVADLHRRDVNRVVDPILKRGAPVEAARTFEDVRAMVNWAHGKGYLDSNPIGGMPAPAENAPRDRVLTDEEIRQLWNGLSGALPRSKACQRILKLCLLTAQRVGEVSGMTKAELDLEGAVWTIPAERTKNGHSHTVPLSPQARSILSDAIQDAGNSAHVFPNAEGKGPLPGAAVAHTVDRANKPDQERPRGRFGIAHFTAHDLRRTAVSNMAKLGVPPIVLGHVINHRSVMKAGVTMAVYTHYDYAKEKREALESWAIKVGGIVQLEQPQEPNRAA